jgi:hypothetical protein
MGETDKFLKKVTDEELIDIGIELMDFSGYGIEHCYELFSDPKGQLECLRKKLNKLKNLQGFCVAQALDLKIKLEQLKVGSEEQKESARTLEVYTKLIPLVNNDSNLIKNEIKIQLERDPLNEVRRKQNAWNGLLNDSFKDFLSGLSQIGYISRICAENWENILNDHFLNNNLYCGIGNRIEWDGTWEQYSKFYYFSHKYNIFSNINHPGDEKGAEGVFFEAHCLKKSTSTGLCERKTAAQVRKGVGGGNPMLKEESDILEQIFQNQPTHKQSL